MTYPVRAVACPPLGAARVRSPPPVQLLQKNAYASILPLPRLQDKVHVQQIHPFNKKQGVPLLISLPPMQCSNAAAAAVVIIATMMRPRDHECR